jgi:hypothetical protein
MDFRDVKIELVIPMITGIYCSLFLCTLIGFSSGVFKQPEKIEPVVEIIHEEEPGNFLLAVTENIQDPVLSYFRNPEFREWVIDFFSGICTNRDIVQAILENADTFDVSPALAFALSWEESRFNPNAVNRYNRDGSIDRGLFQLNNRSFPNLELALFFDIKTNTYYGIGHLRYCLDTGGSEVSALAMYNAGTGRVRTSGAPEVTLNYISRILGNKSKIESQFHARLIREEERRLAEARLAENAESAFQPSWRGLNTQRTLTTASPL